MDRQNIDIERLLERSAAARQRQQGERTLLVRAARRIDRMGTAARCLVFLAAAVVPSLVVQACTPVPDGHWMTAQADPAAVLLNANQIIETLCA